MIKKFYLFTSYLTFNLCILAIMPNSSFAGLSIDPQYIWPPNSQIDLCILTDQSLLTTIYSEDKFKFKTEEDKESFQSNSKNSIVWTNELTNILQLAIDEEIKPLELSIQIKLHQKCSVEHPNYFPIFLGPLIKNINDEEFLPYGEVAHIGYRKNTLNYLMIAPQFKKSINKLEIKNTFLHELLHLLGLFHEHLNIGIDEDIIDNYLSFNYEDELLTIKKEYSVRQFTSYDPDSILNGNLDDLVNGLDREFALLKINGLMTLNYIDQNRRNPLLYNSNLKNAQLDLLEFGYFSSSHMHKKKKINDDEIHIEVLRNLSHGDAFTLKCLYNKNFALKYCQNPREISFVNQMDLFLPN
jgi:hypothetical protein